MSKRIIIAALCLAVVAFALAACNKNKGYEENTTTTIEYSTEENGEVYVTNVNGEHIPVTTGKDGSMEMYEDLITKTEAQVSEEKKEIEAENNANNGDNSGNSGNSGSGSNSGNTTNSSSNGQVVVGSGSASDTLDDGKAAVIYFN